MNIRRIIAIDPDQEQSGVCLLNLETKTVDVFKMAFPDLIELLRNESEDQFARAEVGVIIEGGWLNEKSNWHGGRSIGIASRIGKNVGANHQTGRLIAEMAKRYKMNYRVVAPLRKCWRGTNGKITKEELDALMMRNNIPPILTRTNQDQRDAILLALFHSNMIRK